MSTQDVLSTTLAFMTMTFITGLAMYWAVSRLRRPRED
jgi:membrane protein insertase Oxa1/YidC/SpoIIIJ